MYYTPDVNTTVTTHLYAYKRNLVKIKSYIGSSVRLMAVIKANAYGHGMIECARTALDAGASMLGVCYASEGIALRNEGITAPILAFGPESANSLSAMIDKDITIGIPSGEMLSKLEQTLSSQKKACKIHIKVDTGMGRIGVPPGKAIKMVEKAWNMPGVTVEGIFSHFPSADEERDSFSVNQIETFTRILSRLEQRGMRPDIAHICNSAGTLKFPEAHFDLVRPGIMTYGLLPYPGSESVMELEPVMSLESRITFIKEVPAGFDVSYSGTFVTKRPSRLATVPIGYAHGFKRFLSNRGRGLVNGISVPIAGRICMDQTVFDITDAGDVTTGDSIVLLGKQGDERIPVEEHADYGGTITHEIVTGITGRVSRIYIESS